MNTYEKIITLDVDTPDCSTVVYAKQNDNLNRKLLVILKVGGVAFEKATGDMAVFRYTRPNGTNNIANATILSNGFIEVTFDEQLLAVPGKIVCDVEISNGGTHRLSTPLFIVQNDKSPTGETQIAKLDDYQLLLQTVAKAAVDNARLNELIESGTPEGAEVIDIRVGADGHVYSTAGEAVRAQFQELSDELEYNAYDVCLLYGTEGETTSKGVTYSWVQGKKSTCIANGTSTGESIANLISGAAPQPQISVGDEYTVVVESTANALKARVFSMLNGSIVKNFGGMGAGVHTIKIEQPADAFIVRAELGLAETVTNDQISVQMFNTKTNKELANESLIAQKEFLASGMDANDLRGNKVWFVTEGRTYYNLPTEISLKAGILETLELGSNPVLVQRFYPYRVSDSGIYIRSKLNTSSEWTAWRKISSGGTNVYNTINQNHYTNTLNATVSPTITTDTNNYLASTGTTEDVKASIEAMLSTSKVCRLGVGNFYVSGIDMPADSMLIGSGASTKVILLGTNSDEGYAIHLNDRCSVKDMSILGNANNISYSSLTSSNIVERHGLLFEASNSTDSSTKKKCTIENVWIRNFTGGGIAAYDTGADSDSCMSVTDAYIFNCEVGIYIPYSSEFHRFVNCQAHECYFGAINNGGNCLFDNCNFSKNRVGMSMDNSNGLATNNSHGTVHGCIFDHADSNNGVGIKIIGMTNGQVFSDCQLFYADIEVQNSTGIQFNNFNVGGRAKIKVRKGENGGLILFNNFVIQHGSYTLDIESGYNLVKFSNCWTRTGSAVGT